MAVNISGAPTSKTPGKIGDHLVDSITGKVYECISVNTYGGHDAVTFKRKKTEYVWKCIGDDPNYGSAPYQQLVTDADGNAKWEDRLAYEVPEQWKLFTLDDDVELAACCSREAYEAGKTFRVVIDGQVFDDVPVVEYYSAGRVYGIGEPINDSNPVWSDDGYGFLIRATLTVAYNPDKFSSKPKLFTDTFVYELVSPSNIKQIDQKYIPSPNVIVNITRNEDGTGSADKTYAEVKALIDSGADVKCRVETSVADYVGLNEQGNVMCFEATTFGGFYLKLFIWFAPDEIFTEIFHLSERLLPEVSASDNSNFLSVVNGAWQASSNLIVPSSTSGSTKKFKITVDDSGTISATEVT